MWLVEAMGWSVQLSLMLQCTYLLLFVGCHRFQKKVGRAVQFARFVGFWVSPKYEARMRGNNPTVKVCWPTLASQ